MGIDEKTFTIRLVHYSFQEFLNTFWEEANPHAEMEVVSTCLTYLSFDEFAIPGRSLEGAVASYTVVPPRHDPSVAPARLPLNKSLTKL